MPAFFPLLSLLALCQLWHRTPLQSNSAAYMWRNTNFCFISTSMQFSAKLVSLSSSEITLRIAKAGTRRWLKHSSRRKKVEGESFLYLHFLEQIIILPLTLWELQPQSTFSKILKAKHMQQCELVRVLIMRNRTKVVFKIIQCSPSHENCLLQSTI